MTVAPMLPQDACELLRIAAQRELGVVDVHPNSHGAVVRDGESVRAYAFMRSARYGEVVEDLWSECSIRGARALHTLSTWIEDKVHELAVARGVPVSLGGIVMRGNRRHFRALRRRGYRVVGFVLAKEIGP